MIRQLDCYFCESEDVWCITEDIGGGEMSESGSNIVDVCLKCAISDRIRRFEEKELSFMELKKEIEDILNDN